MDDKYVNIKVDLTQVIDGKEYKGSVYFDECRFDYNLKFDTPVEELEHKEDIDDFLKHFHFEVTDQKGENLELDRDLQFLFMASAGVFAIEFYLNPQTRDSQQGFFGMALRGTLPVEGIEADIGASREFRGQTMPALDKLLANYRN
jgi:hypothetical protein